jgi:hypothetical protein
LQLCRRSKFPQESFQSLQYYFHDIFYPLSRKRLQIWYFHTIFCLTFFSYNENNWHIEIFIDYRAVNICFKATISSCKRPISSCRHTISNLKPPTTNCMRPICNCAFLTFILCVQLPIGRLQLLIVALQYRVAE